MNRIMWRWLEGPAENSLTLTIRDRTGGVRDVALRRTRELWSVLRQTESVQLLPGNIGYVDLGRLLTSEVDGMFEKLRGTRAIVFDMRGVARGTLYYLLAHLPHDRRSYAQWRLPMALAPAGIGDLGTKEAAWSLVQEVEQYVAPSSTQYLGRTAMLIDERAASAAEHHAMGLSTLAGTTLVGSNTAGVDGSISRMPLPGGITMMFTAAAVLQADGSQLQRVGVSPHVRAVPTVAGIRQGRDEVLEKALEILGAPVQDKLTGVGDAP
jgi:C-terminal processing protease CtpA/Prc